ncbi:class I adenylate-forming enzyme family protein [Streptomyces sp. V3I7]|uniref:class I adenylate-forming enzyme family protein n=1 Tax=Streptomyces sp. V3I7 TaxID=3042278 RepID=UPI00278763EE|nr:class I adenylate-forming enzyme family protein [Streptomyces sp. V3I7]MDQ0994381.1 acyl-coenzyme A synthetase/AMP-(fatty) acid ligase [Streptomyces sp. V3I7]
MKPYDMGVLFDECAAHGIGTRVHVDRPLDIDPARTTPYGVPELAELVRQAAAWFAAVGAGPGERIALVKDNHWDYDLLACAAVRIGAVPAKLSGGLPPDVLRILLDRLSPALLVTTSATWKGLAETGSSGGGARRTLLLDGSAPGALSMDDVRNAPVPAPWRRHDTEPLVITHTSGTTGVPKLVAHSTRSIIGKLARFESVRVPRIGLRRDDSLVNMSAYAHGRTFCWTASTLCLGPAEVTFVTAEDAALADPFLRAHPPTVMEATPASYVRLLPLTGRLDHPFHRVRTYVSTYDAMHPPTIRAYLTASGHRSPLWLQGWGQTETGPLTFRVHTRASAGPGRSGSRNVGRPVPFRTRLRVVDPRTRRAVPRGRAGVILARTEALALDYVGESDRWAAQTSADGWWDTGDVGVRRPDGSVDLLDRAVDLVPRMSCLRTEDLLEERLPQVVECVVLAAPDGPQPVIVLAGKAPLDDGDWQMAVRGLPPLNPPIILTWDEVPRTATGKVRRRELLRRLAASPRPADPAPHD